MSRAIKSVPPPGANGATMRTGLLGYCWADAGSAASTPTAASDTYNTRYWVPVMETLLEKQICGRTLQASFLPSAESAGIQPEWTHLLFGLDLRLADDCAPLGHLAL